MNFDFQKVNGDEKKETPMEVDETGKFKHYYLSYKA